MIKPLYATGESKKSVAVDGSEDGDIHCLKSGEVAADTAEEICQLTAEMLASQPDDEDDDPFADLDESNSDENELWRQINYTLSELRRAPY